MNQIKSFYLFLILLITFVEFNAQSKPAIIRTGGNDQKTKNDLQDIIHTVSGLGDQIKKVKISGKLINFPNNVEIEDFSDTQGFSVCPAERIIITDDEGRFDITFSLNQPKYFRIGRNVVYLSPGDVMNVVIDKNNYEQSEFSGSGSILNLYLRKTPFPKGGSYVAAGKNLFPSAAKSVAMIEQLVHERQMELAAIEKQLPYNFAELEKANIIAHQINSYLSLKGYAVGALKDENLIKSFSDSINILTKDKIESLFESIKDAKNLQLIAFRDILYKTNWKVGKNTAESQKLKDWLKAKNLSSKLNSTQERDKLNELKSSIDSLNSEVYKIVLLENLHTKLTFLPGDKAKDFEVVLPDGMKTHLSNLNGKVIYIDIWATWCGPCMAEMPHLETLKEKYKDNQDIAIVSLSIDDTDKIWLKNLDKRKPGGIQWRIERSKLSDYNVTSIPRCIVIDKNFNVVSLYAPNPSDASISKMLETLANNNLK